MPGFGGLVHDLGATKSGVTIGVAPGIASVAALGTGGVGLGAGASNGAAKGTPGNVPGVGAGLGAGLRTGLGARGAGVGAGLAGAGRAFTRVITPILCGDGLVGGLVTTMPGDGGVTSRFGCGSGVEAGADGFPIDIHHSQAPLQAGSARAGALPNETAVAMRNAARLKDMRGGSRSGSLLRGTTLAAEDAWIGSAGVAAPQGRSIDLVNA